MKSEIIKKTDTEVTFRISVDEHAIEHAREHAFEHFRPRVKVAGFRPGKAPDHIVSREIGDAVIQNEVIEHAMGHAYSDAINSERLMVIAQPQIEIKKWVPYSELEFEAKVEIVPPVKLPDYKKIKKPLKTKEVADKDIDAVVEDLRRRVASRVPAIRPAEIGDEVKIDFEGSLDGKPVEGAKSEGYTLKLGSNTFIPGFEEEVVGLKVDDEKTFKVTFPKDYHEKNLAGKPVEFKIKVHEVTSLEMPELNDKFASEVGPFKTVKELREDIKKQLTLEAEEAGKREFENELLEEITEKSQVKVPDALVAQQVERLKADLAQRLAGTGLTVEQYLQMQKKTQDDMEKELKPEAEKRVKLALVLSEVAKAEGLTVGMDEIQAEIDVLRQRYTDPEMQKELSGERIKEDVYNHLMAGKAISKLVDYAKK